MRLARSTTLNQHWVDDMVDAYVDWREACVAVRNAYRRWSDASSGDEALAFGTYQATLDREERTAQAYANLVARLAGRDPVPAPGG